MTEIDRRTYLGGPDVAAIVGVSPYSAPIDVYRFHVGLDEAPVQTDRMALGLRLEQAIAETYTDQTGRKVRRVGFVRHPIHAFLGGHPDRLVVGEPGVLEAKAAATTAGYTDDEPPPHVKVQGTWYCGLTRREWCDVALLAHMGVRVLRVPFEPDLYAALEEAAIRFWREHILAGVEPLPDGSESYRRHLAEKYPRSEEVELVATPEQALLIDELREAEGAKANADRHVDELENRIREAMGSAAVLVSEAGRITWRTEAPRPRWQQIAQAIAEAHGVDLPAQVAADKAGRDGPRVIRKSWTKAEARAAA